MGKSPGRNGQKSLHSDQKQSMLKKYAVAWGMAWFLPMLALMAKQLEEKQDTSYWKDGTIVYICFSLGILLIRESFFSNAGLAEAQGGYLPFVVYLVLAPPLTLLWRISRDAEKILQSGELPNFYAWFQGHRPDVL
ncbi:MAG: hypothetical protein LBJ11_04180 [Oscillospiraceae bacterium]|jgi:hypothetical protein|nr:hypothetical protein [Oscillospiraceae bacterium]